MLEFLLVQSIIVIGACLQGLVGFGLGMFAAPLLMLLAPQYVPGPMILNALLLTLAISWKHRQRIDRPLTSVAIGGGTLGVLLAALCLTLLDGLQYRMLFGALIMIAVALSWIGAHPPMNKLSNLIAGFMSGFMGTVTSAGGAPMGLVYQHANADQRNANLNAFFLYINLFGIVMLALNGFVGWHDVQLFLESIPALLLGWWLAKPVGQRLDAQRLRQLVLLVAFGAGLMSVLW